MEYKDFITIEYKFDGHKSESKDAIENHVKKFLSELFNPGFLSKTKFATITNIIFRKKVSIYNIRHTVYITPKDDTIDLKLSTGRENKIKFSKIYSYPIKNGNIKTYEKFILDSVNNFDKSYKMLKEL